ncbi:MAG: GNAT family N-acetyltransferase, partial [bacterium]|nr:GNAT family N-acetyltransferase [bacterium]
MRAVFGSPLPEITVRGDNLELRPFAPSDLPVVEEASRDPLIPKITTVPSDYSAIEGRAFIDRQTSRLSSGEGWSLAIVDQEAQLPVGQIGLWIPQIHKGRAEIGYWVAQSGRGRNIAGRALKLLSDWAFQNLDLDRLTLFIEPWNVASVKTAESAGYQREGLLRSWERVAGTPKDMYSFVLLAP